MNQLIIRIQNNKISINIVTKDENEFYDFTINECNKKTEELENDYDIVEDNPVENENKYTWEIIIPSINLYADICEETSMDVLDEAVGHFSETSISNGNIGLAAHNRGYKNNYFQNVKYLEIGDEIIYKYMDMEKTYYVETIEIIDETDWSYLEETKDSRITLITCIENEPQYRLCVQGIINE